MILMILISTSLHDTLYFASLSDQVRLKKNHPDSQKLIRFTNIHQIRQYASSMTLTNSHMTSLFKDANNMAIEHNMAAIQIHQNSPDSPKLTRFADIHQIYLYASSMSLTNSHMTSLFKDAGNIAIEHNMMVKLQEEGI